MLPYISFFGKTIPMYGLMAGIGLGFAVLYMELAGRRRREIGGDTEIALVCAIVGAFVCAKILFLLTIIPQIAADIPMLRSQPMAFLIKYMSGGFVFYGGFIGAVLGVLVYARAAHVSVQDLLGVMAPMLPLIHAFGRIGCFMAGCCYGRPAVHAHWGIAFTANEISPLGIPLIPVQLYEAAAEFIIFALLALLAYKGVKGVDLLCIFVFVYGVVRFVLEFFRGDAARGFIGPLSVSQMIALACAVVAGIVVLMSHNKAKRERANA